MKREPERLRRKSLFASERTLRERGAQSRPPSCPGRSVGGYSPLLQKRDREIAVNPRCLTGG